MATIFVPDVPEFAPLVSAAKSMPNVEVSRHGKVYLRITSRSAMEFRRKDLGVKPAIWYGLFTGGIEGRIEQFDRDVVRIVDGEGE